MPIRTGCVGEVSQPGADGVLVGEGDGVARMGPDGELAALTWNVQPRQVGLEASTPTASKSPASVSAGAAVG